MIDYAALFASLQVSPRVSRDLAWQRQTRMRFREELMLGLLMLRDLGVAVIGPRHPTPPSDCDLCGQAMTRMRAFVNGETLREPKVQAFGIDVGPWANMCSTCYLREGAGLGYGLGQLYLHLGEDDDGPIWRLLGGGDPTVSEI